MPSRVGQVRGWLALPALSLTVALALAAGCAARPRLLDERRVEPYASLVALGASQPRETRVATFPSAAAGRVEVAYHVVRAPAGAAASVLVLQPGVLADAATWRFLAPRLAERHDLVLIDPPGTGLSGVPDPRVARAPAYTPAWLAGATLAALTDFERTEPAPRPLVLVGHSLGGTVVLRALADPALLAQHGPLLSRVERAVLLAPADLGLSDVDERLVAIRDLSDLEAALGGALGIVQRKVEQGTYDSVLEPGRSALVGEARRLGQQLCRAPQRHAAQAMLRRFLPLNRCGQPDRETIRGLTEQERAIAIPLLVLWGDRDDTLRLPSSGPLLERLPTARLQVLSGKHSLHQERASEVAEAILAFVAEAAPGAPLPSAPAAPR